MKTLTIKDLARNDELERAAMASVHGGIGRTPQQTLAWQVTGQPATWQGLVLRDDGRLSVPGI